MLVHIHYKQSWVANDPLGINGFIGYLKYTKICLIQTFSILKALKLKFLNS